MSETLLYEVYLPPGHHNGQGLPYLLVLPGYRDDHTYCRRKGLFAAAEALMGTPGIPDAGIVCVGRGRGIWIDAWPADRKYETALVDDLLNRLVHRHGFPSEAGRRGILGISLGGFGALKTGLRHPALFGSVGALSPYLDPNYEAKVRARQFPWEQGSAEERKQVFGPDFDVEKALREDPLWLAAHAGPTLPPFFLVCGRQDRYKLADPQEELRRRLIQAGADVQGGSRRVATTIGSGCTCFRSFSGGLRDGSKPLLDIPYDLRLSTCYRGFPVESTDTPASVAFLPRR